jgi:hypothetical protein
MILPIIALHSGKVNRYIKIKIKDSNSPKKREISLFSNGFNKLKIDLKLY